MPMDLASPRISRARQESEKLVLGASGSLDLLGDSHSISLSGIKIRHTPLVSYQCVVQENFHPPPINGRLWFESPLPKNTSEIPIHLPKDNLRNS